MKVKMKLKIFKIINPLIVYCKVKEINLFNNNIKQSSTSTAGLLQIFKVEIIN